MNVRQKLFLAALCTALPVLASAQAAAPAEPPKMESKLYGFVLLTGTMQNGVFSAADYPGKISAEQTGDTGFKVDNKTLGFGARQSRFGWMINNADAGVLCAKAGGRVEADFYGSATSVSHVDVSGSTVTKQTTTTTPGSLDSALLRLRYAYGWLTWDFAQAGKLTLTVGQTDGLVNALHPELAAYVAAPLFQYAGNLTRRSPQVRVGYDYSPIDMLALTLEAAVMNPQDKGGTDSSIYFDAGNNANSPDIEAHLQAAVKPMADVKATVGVGYHTNKQTYGLGTAKEQSLTSTLIGVDANIDATKYLNLRGEYFSGKGADEGQGGAFGDLKVSTAGSRELLKTNGYWFQAVIKPIAQVWLVGGMGQEKAEDLYNTKYTMVNVGVIAPVTKNWRFGLEYTSSKKKADAYGTTAAEDFSGTAVALSSRFSF